jgi:hypothetical protein
MLPVPTAMVIPEEISEAAFLATVSKVWSNETLSPFSSLSSVDEDDDEDDDAEKTTTTLPLLS